MRPCLQSALSIGHWHHHGAWLLKPSKDKWIQMVGFCAIELMIIFHMWTCVYLWNMNMNINKWYRCPSIIYEYIWVIWDLYMRDFEVPSQQSGGLWNLFYKFGVEKCWNLSRYQPSEVLTIISLVGASRTRMSLVSRMIPLVLVKSSPILVGGLEHVIFVPYIENNHPNWLSSFSEG